MDANLQEQLLLLPNYFQAHLVLTLAALGLGIAISIPLGIIAAQSSRAKQPLLTAVSIIQTVPSIAILALTVALLGGEIGFVPAAIALTLYSMLPIVRNTVTGLENVADEVIEAAQGIGMSPSQILVEVKIPLALPVIIAGIRTAAVWTVGLATLSTVVGATSFGNYIFTGLQTRNLTAVIVGSVGSAVMAVSLDWFIGGIQWLTENRLTQRHTQRFKKIRIAVVGAGILGLAISIYSLRPTPQADFIVGGKGFTEQHILAGLLSAELEAEGFTVDQRIGMGSEVVYEAVSNSVLDIYVEYTGTIWANIMGRDDNPGRQQILSSVSEYINTEDGLLNVGPMGFKNLYAMAMKRTRAEELGIETIDDLVPYASSFIAGGDLEFFGRPEWAKIRDTYRIDFAEKLTFDTALMYAAVSDGQVDVISAYSTDGRIAAYDLVLLEDPRNAVLPYDGIIVVSEQATKNARLLEILERLTDTIPDDVMREANKIVDVDGGTISDAVSYLQSVIN